MTIRSLALSLAAATGLAAAAAVLSYSSSAPAAVRIDEAMERPDVSLPTVSLPAVSQPAILQPASLESAPPRREADDACREAVWPYVPAACMRGVASERIKRPVRIIPIDALAALK